MYWRSGMDNTDKQFATVREQANGMLAPVVYQRMNEYAKNIPGSVMVEVGTAHGAATIALALAGQTSGKRVVTFERGHGGSRARYGSVDDNVAIIEENFRKFGVENLIDLRVGEVETQGSSLNETDRVGLLLIDADGCIDRDLELFAPNMEPGAIVVIDDCEDRARIIPRGIRQFRIDLKHRLTYRLVEYYRQQGVLEEIEVVKNTFFGRWSAEAGKSLSADKSDIVRIYRSLILTDGRLENLVPTGIKRAIRKVISGLKGP
jgi:predicted O-methyltransferase YrrM